MIPLRRKPTYPTEWQVKKTQQVCARTRIRVVVRRLTHCSVTDFFWGDTNKQEKRLIRKLGMFSPHDDAPLLTKCLRLLYFGASQSELFQNLLTSLDVLLL